MYATDFARARGYQFYEHENIRLAVIRYEDLNRCVAEVMREFLGIPQFQMAQSNVGEDKKYGELYRQVRSILRLPPERVKELNGTQYASISIRRRNWKQASHGGSNGTVVNAHGTKRSKFI